MGLNQKQAVSFKGSLEKFSDGNIEVIQKIYQEALERKGKALIQKDAISAAAMFEDNAFSQLRDFLKHNLQVDPDVIFASFSTKEGKDITAWQVVTSDYADGLDMPISFNKKKATWQSTYRGKEKVNIQDPIVADFDKVDAPVVRLSNVEVKDENGQTKTIRAYVCIAPVYKKNSTMADIVAAKKAGNTIGYLRYTISLAGVEKAIANQKRSLADSLSVQQEENKKTEKASSLIAMESLREIYKLTGFGFLAVIIFSYLLSLRSSGKLTKPIQNLTVVAEKMAGGNYRQEITDNSDDEIGILTDAFRRMSAAIVKRDEELAEINANLEKLVEKRTLQLQEQFTLVSNLLNNMQQAVFTIDADLRVVAPVSRYATKLFGRPIEQENILDVVYTGLDRSSEEYGKLSSSLGVVFGEGDLQWMSSEADLLRSVTVPLPNGDRILRINYNPLWDSNENLNALMFVVEDVTELLMLEKKVEAERATNERRVKIIQELAMGNADQISAYFKNSNILLAEMQADCEKCDGDNEATKAIKRNAHTLKGNSRLHGYSLISSSIHRIESEMEHTIKDNVEGKSSVDDFKSAIKEHVKGIRLAIADYELLAKEVFRIEGSNKGPAGSMSLKTVQVSDIGLRRLEQVLFDTQSGSDVGNLRVLFGSLFTVPLPDVFSDLAAMIEEICSALKKKVQFDFKGDQLVEVTREEFRVLSDAVGHILRNALDHGIELPEERTQNGKQPAGHITAEWEESSKGITLKIIDDGRGIDPERVAQSAISKGLITADAAKAMSANEKIELIFLPSFSTKDEVSEISGRGVGMDAVKTAIGRVGGEVVVTSNIGKGTEFKIEIPKQKGRALSA